MEEQEEEESPEIEPEEEKKKRQEIGKEEDLMWKSCFDSDICSVKAKSFHVSCRSDTR